jgi:hypothetical protein
LHQKITANEPRWKTNADLPDLTYLPPGNNKDLFMCVCSISVLV